MFPSFRRRRAVVEYTQKALKRGKVKPAADIFKLIAAPPACFFFFLLFWRLTYPRAEDAPILFLSWRQMKHTKSRVRARLSQAKPFSTPPPPLPLLPSIFISISPSISLPVEYCHSLWTEISTLPLQRHTVVTRDVICMIMRSWRKLELKLFASIYLFDGVCVPFALSVKFLTAHQSMRCINRCWRLN